MGRVFLNMRPQWLLVALFFQYLTYFFEAKSYDVILRLWKYVVAVESIMKRLVISRFIGRSVPSLSIAGNVYVAKKFSEDGLPKNDAIQTVLMNTVNYYLAVLIFAAFSYLYLWTHNKLTLVEVIFFALFVLIAYAIFAVGYFGAKKHRRLGVYYDKFIGRFHTAASELFGEGNSKQQERPEEGKIDRREAPMLVPMAFVWEIARFLADSITIYFIFVGLGERTHFGIVMVGFAMATIFGLISFFPGGIGQFEAAQILVYGSLGVPVQAAIAATLIYRLLSFWLPLPLGAYLYKRKG